MPKGFKGFQKGYRQPDKVLEKIRQARIGYKLSDEQKRKISNAHKGMEKPWLRTPEVIKKAADSKRGSKNFNWKGGRYKDARGYIQVMMPNHPAARAGKYVLEHRLVMEKILGRYLERNELVHHKNGVKDDNRIENLIIVQQKNHHGKVVCPHCLKDFLIK